MNTWKQECVYLLKRLGGHAYLKDIYNEFINNGTKDHVENYTASIRDALEKGSKESLKFDGEELFYMVDGKNRGHYGLIEYDPINTENIDLTQEDDEFSEGKLYLRKHIARERNQLVITKAKQAFKRKYGKLFCEVCGFDFYKLYGDLGENFIEAHHIKPISEMQENEKTKIEDIVMVCSNCHSMIHRKKPWLTKDKLKSIIK